MPTRRSALVLALRDLTFGEWFALVGSWWRPDLTGHLVDGVRFRTWAEFFAVYDAVRDELLAQPRRPWAPFGELARARFRAGQDPAGARAAYDAGIAAYTRRVPPVVTRP